MALLITAGLLAYCIQDPRFDLRKALLACAMVLLVAGAIARFTIQLLTRPLAQLKQAIEAVSAGHLDKIEVSRSGDEIEFLGRAFNAMIAALDESRTEVRRYHDELEDRILQRTEEIEQALHRALAASQAKSDFLTRMSHELRTPMTGVIGMLDLVLDSHLDGLQREQIEISQRSAYFLLSVLNDLFDLSKIEAGRMVLEKVAFETRTLVAECAKPYGAAAAEKQVDFKVHFDGHVPEKLVGDPMRIRQILTNILSNAVKFTDCGAIRMEVSADCIAEQGVELKFEISDTGIGIAEDKLPLVFDKFCQADESNSRRHGGSGLGLAITRRLVEMHGGTISVQSTPGEGSVFSVQVLCETVTRPVRESKPSVDTSVSESPAGRILIVEDNMINQRVVTSFLRKRNHQFVIANNGQEALDLLAAAPDPLHYSMVLMDLQMPVLDGLEATRRIRSDPRWEDLPIIAMTANAMMGDREACLEAGMNAYISKPLNLGHVLSTVERFSQVERRAAAQVSPAPSSSNGHAPKTPDSDLVAGMLKVFLQLAPERMQRLSTAAQQKDSEKLISESNKIAATADRISAIGVSTCTREIADAVSTSDYLRVQQSLIRLAEEINRLQQQYMDLTVRAALF